MEKLGNVTLEKYAELAERHGQGDKPKKLTRKQWDKIEAHVQAFHEANATASEEAASDGNDRAESDGSESA
jgi:hypothetical protein